MPSRPAPALAPREGDRAELERWTRSSLAPAGLAQPARIVLMAADGVGNTEIADSEWGDDAVRARAGGWCDGGRRLDGRESSRGAFGHWVTCFEECL
jgi:hypothetical protein